MQSFGGDLAYMACHVRSWVRIPLDPQKIEHFFSSTFFSFLVYIYHVHNKYRVFNKKTWKRDHFLRFLTVVLWQTFHGWILSESWNPRFDLFFRLNIIFYIEFFFFFLLTKLRHAVRFIWLQTLLTFSTAMPHATISRLFRHL